MYRTDFEIAIACVYKEFGKVRAVKTLKTLNKGHLGIEDAMKIIAQKFPNGRDSAADLIEEVKIDHSEYLNKKSDKFIW